MNIVTTAYAGHITSPNNRIATIKNVEDSLTTQAIKTPIPGEPEDISDKERYALYAEIPEFEALVSDTIKKYSTHTGDNVTVFFFLSTAISVFFLILTTLLYAEGFLHNQNWTLFTSGSIFAVSLPSFIYLIRRQSVHIEMREAAYTLLKNSWRKVFISTLNQVEGSGIKPCSHLISVRHTLEDQNQTSISNRLSMADVVGMVRLASAIRETSGRQGSNARGQALNVSGENSELLSRVCETLSNKTVCEVTAELENLQPLVV